MDLDPTLRPDDDTQFQYSWDVDRDVELASKTWAKFPERAKALFGTLIDNPGREYTGEELAELLSIPNGKAGVAGVLAHPGRQLKKVNRRHHFFYGEKDGVGTYSMLPEMAELFDRARQADASANTGEATS